MSTRSSYAASANPARKAKRARLVNSTDALQGSADLRSASPHQPFILPKPASKPIVDTPPVMTLSPVKRGRKPSGVSRASREAQRKLNHSIIEKARRTKINEALSTLSSLIPADYDNRPADVDDTGKEDADDSGDDDEDYVDRKQTAGRRGGPKKEKEFKLEILVKTVAYMQDLIQRVTDLEAEAKVPASASLPSPSCANCGTRTATKRKRGASDSFDGTREPASDESATPRLPSISEMLSERTRDVDAGSYLPSPPSSTKFPARGRSDSLDIPPPLSLGPTLQAAAAKSSSPATQSCAAIPLISPTTSPLLSPEDESAASLLLNMRSSTIGGHGMRDLEMGNGGFASHALSREYVGKEKQTPSSLLGIVL
ncbi:uncharacterized protein SCHCODRAFT_02619061 [Schizophyllum commune H4-8]|uniref:BHLH domain-containing protein n=1 Tax=Schizophyllum commune (strain H4-8 / FGSC 9210) TaxID=578458 RepID=D8Q184_SCHCM|nr:uncharacterized protein SCHCODRAFT_02619061 [Schizophyllum commune H4-8]KAI5895312.1 hypothetical protein SCHCODRAFT_02619061 [Schizophyllum commune H4-8]